MSIFRWSLRLMIPCILSVPASHEPLAHVENLTAPGIPSVLRWWCALEGHAAGPLCVRHEISLQMSKAYGIERRQQHQHRQSLLGEGASQELKQALAAFCNERGGNNSSGVCSGARGGGAGRTALRARQLVAMNEWWCAQEGHGASLVCARHRLQQKYLDATETMERETVRSQLEGLLSNVAKDALDKLREDSREMQRRYCAQPPNALLELCTQPAATSAQRLRPSVGRAKSARGRKRDAGGARQKQGRGAIPMGERSGSNSKTIWTPQALGALKAWWCADSANSKDTRCAPTVEWTRSLALGSGLRNYFCLHGNATSAAWLLCSKAAPLRHAHGTASSSERRSDQREAQANAPHHNVPHHGQPHHGTGVLRAGGVLKVLLALLFVSALLGWKARGHIGKSAVIDRAGEGGTRVAVQASMRRRGAKRAKGADPDAAEPAQGRKLPAAMLAAS